MTDVIIIGAGANGLVAAAALAKSGRRVLVLESEPEVGGTWSPVEIVGGVKVPLETEADWIPAPVASLVVLRSNDVEMLRAVTRACGMSALVASRTTPKSVAVVVCPRIGTAPAVSSKVARR